MKILLLDIETSPHLAMIWGSKPGWVHPKNFKEVGKTICWAAKWLNQRGVLFDSSFQSAEREMVGGIWNLLDEADAVIHYNGARFDVPTLNKEFLTHGMHPPKPYHQIDLLKTIRKEFRLHSNKLDEVLRHLGMQTKVSHKGMELWAECMENDPKAWKQMERYNRRDVAIMEGLYKRILPWIKNHPNHALYLDDTRPCCPNCGSRKVKKDGTRTTKTQKYQQYKCGDCGTWIKGRNTILPPDKRVNVLVQA